MSYKVIVRPAAEKFILRLNESDYGAIVERLRSLEQEPRPPRVKKLAESGLWRIRVGSFRVIYAIDDKESLVVVVRVAKRTEDTYRRL